MKGKFKILTVLLTVLTLISLFAFTTLAENTDAESDRELGESTEANTTEEVYNPAEEIYLAVTENADKILSLLALIGSLLVAFAYKRGLLPLLRGGLSALNEVVGSIKSKTDEGGESVKRLEELIEMRLSAAEEVLSSIGESLQSTLTEVRRAEERAPDGEELRRLISEEVELLYSIFMSSSLPAYQKDEVERKILAIREELKANDGQGA